MKKILSLLALLMVAFTTAWAGDVATFNLGTKNGVSTPEGFFKSVGEKWNWNSKFNGGEYDDISFTQGLKMEGSTKIGFTTSVASTVTIVQSTWSDKTIKFDDEELAVNDATEGTGCRIYTLTDVAAGDHVISRGSGESGLFYVKVEYTEEDKTPAISASPKELKLVVLPITPNKTVTATIVLNGKNLTDGTYNTPIPAEEAITITPAQFTVASGEVSQEFTVTYKPVNEVADGFTKIFFEVGDLSAGIDISYKARFEAYEQTIVSEETTWNWEALTETIELNETTVPSIKDEFVFKELEDQINFGSFDAQSIVISKTQYPVRSKKFQNGTIKFTTDRPGVITVDFSDTGSSGDGVKRYLNVNGNDTEYYTQRDGSSDRKVSGEIAVPAGEVAITGWDPEAEIKDADGNVIGTGKNVAICIYKVTFTPTGDAVNMLANIKALKEYSTEEFGEQPAVLTLKDAKVNFVTTKESTDYDDDWNPITVMKDYVLIEDATAGYMLEGSGLGDYVKAGDVLNGTLAITLVDNFGWGIYQAKLINGIQGVTVTASEVQPIVVSDENIMDYLADNDFRLAQFNDAVINIVTGDYSDEFTFSATVMGDDPISIQDTYGIIPETIADGTKGTLTGYMASLYGMTFFTPTAFVENVSDNINAVNAIVGNNAVIFNMQGQRVAQPVKGINIINGKKVVLK